MDDGTQRKEQPTRSGKHREPREFDKTSLRANHHEFRISRDYAAHMVRWGFVRKFINHETTVIDVGCGVDMPLARTLAGGYANTIPSLYLGVDLNALPNRPSYKWATFIERFNFVTHFATLFPIRYDVVVSFEVIEHVSRNYTEAFLSGLKHVLAPNGTLFLSTPNFKNTKARNHCYEFESKELQDLLEKAGFQVVKKYGTFASYHDIKRVAKPDELAILDKLNEFHHGDVTAIFMASLYPEVSRNITWILKHA